MKNSEMIASEVSEAFEKFFGKNSMINWMKKEFHDLYRSNLKFGNQNCQFHIIPSVFEINPSVSHLGNLYKDLSKTKKELLWISILKERILNDKRLNFRKELVGMEYHEIPIYLKLLISLIEKTENLLWMEVNGTLATNELNFFPSYIQNEMKNIFQFISKPLIMESQTGFLGSFMSYYANIYIHFFQDKYGEKSIDIFLQKKIKRRKNFNQVVFIQLLVG